MHSKVPLWAAFFLMVAQDALAEALDWSEELHRVSAMAQDYRDAANNAGEFDLGTMFQGIGFHRHRCYVLGQMLGRNEYVADLAESDEPPTVTGHEAYDMLLFSASLENLAHAISRSSEYTPAHRANTWNRECVGEYSIPASAAVVSPDPSATLTFFGHQVAVQGVFDDGFSVRFAAELQQHPSTDTIQLSSVGGSLSDALEVGRLIRERGLRTVISGSCFDECALVFMAGLDREIYRGHNRLGFSAPTSSPLNQEEAEEVVQAYLSAMNMDADRIWAWMTSSELSRDDNGRYIAEFDQLCSHLVTTFIVDFGRCW